MQGRLALLAEAPAIRAWAEINLGVFDASRSAGEAPRLADETGQVAWAATARIAVALIDAVVGGWSTSHALLTQAEQTAVRTANASSALLAAAQLSRLPGGPSGPTTPNRPTVNRGASSTRAIGITRRSQLAGALAGDGR